MSAPADSDHGPSPAASHLAEAQALLKTGQPQAALSRLLPQVQADPSNPALLHLVSDCYWKTELAERTFVVLDAITQTWPENIAAWYKIGSRKLAVGDKPAAAAAFRQMLDIDPMSAQALTALNLVSPLAPDSPEAEKLRQLAGSAHLAREETPGVWNALGQIAARAGGTAEAMRLYQKCKDATPGAYDPAAMEEKLGQQRQAFAPGKTPEALITSPAPRFAYIVGLPRSGTTLLDVMLGRHPEIGSIGESPGLIDAHVAAYRLMRNRVKDAGHWDWCREAPAELLTAVRQAYLQKNVPPEMQDAAVIVDKMPQNAMEMGFARMILPDARFLFMLRHPLDVGLSIFSKDFSGGQVFSKRLEWIGHMIRTVYASLDDFRPKLGSRLRLQSYRALVEDTEAQMRAILAHLGQEWHPACLSPQDSGQVVRTASVLQVREGINRKGLGRWKPYEAELAPLIAALGGWEWIREWEELDTAAASA